MIAFDRGEIQKLENALDLAHLRAVQMNALFAALNLGLKLDEDSNTFGLIQLGLELTERAVEDLGETIATMRALRPDAPELRP
ncbi:MAG: hypothetical protein MEQ07_09250 [Aquimonas sp.]|nr:hypothetical protein [Aquimonas sp.]